MHRSGLLLAFFFATPSFGAGAKLPLALGYYVEAGAACGEITDATSAHLYEAGLDTRFGICTFDSLVDGGDGTWAYSATCGGGEEPGAFAAKGQITVKSQTGFNIANGEQEQDYTFCTKDMPSAQ